MYSGHRADPCLPHSLGCLLKPASRTAPCYSLYHTSGWIHSLSARGQCVLHDACYRRSVSRPRCEAMPSGSSESGQRNSTDSHPILCPEPIGCLSADLRALTAPEWCRIPGPYRKAPSFVPLRPKMTLTSPRNTAMPNPTESTLASRHSQNSLILTRAMTLSTATHPPTPGGHCYRLAMRGEIATRMMIPNRPCRAGAVF